MLCINSRSGFLFVLLLLAGSLVPWPVRSTESFSESGNLSAPSPLRDLLEKGAPPSKPGLPSQALIDDVRRLYQANGYQLLWSREGKPTAPAVAVLDSLARADERGLNPEDYGGARWNEWLARLAAGTASAEEGWPAFDVRLSAALMRFGDHLHRGRIDTGASGLGIAIERKKPLELVQLVVEIASDNNPAERLDRLEPATEAYRNLKAALRRYRDLANGVFFDPLTFGKSLRPGEKADEVPLLRNCLQALGYPVAGPEGETDSQYDERLAETVRRFQTRHGLEPDGVVGRQTLKELNVSPTERVAQIRFGLERLRWLPDALDGPFIVVNVPAFRLYAFETGAPDFAKPAVAMDVIVGRAVSDRRTPVFGADMRYVVFRPYWNVPDSIAEKELLPLIESDPDYLDRNDMEFAGDSDSGTARLRQRPGPKNALGPVKFVFPNAHGVYLHGTPAQRLFQKARRDFSHGCIRVADPLSLARFVLEREGGWDAERISGAMDGNQTFSVPLSRPIPVYIFYTTALVDGEGQVLFYPDIYGKDARLARLLDGGGG
ncbi:MAG TPA: L,D-transpeptidase family protein [Methylococcaceae bacterium]|nr:L,D-transpeptidase family protein [Methylococcaceae bacterium]